MSTNKSQKICLIALILVTPTSTDQTVIKLTNESGNTNIINKNTIIDNRKEDSHIIIDDDIRNFLTYVNFIRQTKDESIANYSLTDKEKESDLNGTKSVIDAVLSIEDKNNAAKDNYSAKEQVDREERHATNSSYINKQKGSRYLKADYFLRDVVDASHLGNAEKRNKVDDLKVEPRDITNAVQFGIRALEELVKVKEPHLYKLGLFLNENDPAAKVANFGAPTSRKAILMSRIGYATLEASKKIAETFPKNVGRQSPGLHIGPQSRIDLEDCPLRGRPRCPPASRRFRTSDGTCNNLENPWRGSAMLPMQRFLLPVYDDGIQSVRRSILDIPLPSPRAISTAIHRDKNQETQSVTSMFMQWGQFIDHDITSTVRARSFNGSIPRCCEDGGRGVLPQELLHPSCLPIEVPRTDPFLSRFGIGCMEFLRSAPSTRIDCELGWREQINQVTPYLDASTIYGSDVDTSDSIRTFRNGKIFYGRPSGQAPLNPPDPPGGELCREGALSEECLQPGDFRVSENPGLIAIHTIFVRYHNKVASVLSTMNSHWSDERVFQETRRIVYSVIQHITYREYLPVVLGPEVMDLFELRILPKGYYDKYDIRVNAAIANSFSTAAFRFGHSMVQNSFIRADSNHITQPNNVSLHNEFFNFENIWSLGSIDRFLLGLSNQPSQRRDEFIADELTNHLFQFSDSPPFGMDLAAINIQRGRDHGIPPYTSWRKPCGLSPIESWRDLERIISITSVMRLRALYAHIDDIDLFTAGLAEKPLKGAVVGPTFACIIAQQFSNLRKGDRFWYENGAFESSLSPAQLQQIRKVSLSQLICQTMDGIKTIQPFVFLSADNFRNIRVSCDGLERFDLQAWSETSFEFNSVSDNVDPFEQERSPKDLSGLTGLGRKSIRHDVHITMNATEKTLGHDGTFTFNYIDYVFVVPELEKNISHPSDYNSTNETYSSQSNRDKRQIGVQDINRLGRNIKTTEDKATERSRRVTQKTNVNKKLTITKTTSKTNPPEYKYYDNFNNIPSKPTFSVHRTRRPTKNKPNEDVTYLIGLVPERTTRPTSNIPLQLNINIHYSPQPSTTTTTVTSINKNRPPNFTSRPSSQISGVYGASRPTTMTNIYRPTEIYDQNDFVVITKRPLISTRRPPVISENPEILSYPIFVYSPAYDKHNNYYDISTKKTSHFYDNMEYATANGHKRPNPDRLGFSEKPAPTSWYYSNSDSNENYIIKPPHSSYKPATYDFDDFNKPAQNLDILHVSTTFEDQPFSSSRPAYSNSNKHTDRYVTKRPTYSNNYYLDDDSDTVVIPDNNKRRPQGNVYNRDEGTSTDDDILDEFFQRQSEQEEGPTRRQSSDLIEDSTPTSNIDDKLDFKSRIIYKTTVDDKDIKGEDAFVKISAVKKEEIFSREGDDIVKEIISKARTPSERRRRNNKKIRVVDVDVTPSEPSGRWKIFNATKEDNMPFMEVPELPINLPCSYELPTPMTEFLPSPDSPSKRKTR